MTLPTYMTIATTSLFLVGERLLPGRSLPNSDGWYARSLGVNLVQLTITVGAGYVWPRLFENSSGFSLSHWQLPALEGFVAWFIGTFVFYWWHRVRHLPWFWQVFHQVHHSASRIEVLTSFYKHPIEIALNSLMSALILFPLLGCSVLAAFWYNFFAATGEYFYHANVRTPWWLRYFIQTPELHSIHHQYDVHSFNFGDIPLWDRLFGTFRDTTKFVQRCGFPSGAEKRLAEMLLFRDVYRDTAA